MLQTVVELLSQVTGLESESQFFSKELKSLKDTGTASSSIIVDTQYWFPVELPQVTTIWGS